ncbi:MAG TPA: alkaline phosphatase family protein [Solirubrobacteraceae bacterium]|nr:alkaline phosphatase family protein [Solirubrobacteraceae bacterium]
MADEQFEQKNVTRREILRRAGLLGSGVLVGEAMTAWQAGPTWARLIERAAAVKPAGTSYKDIDHFVFLMMENRSYDHYFGAYPKGRGFDDHPKDSLGAFAQYFPTNADNGYVGGNKTVPKNTLLPFHLDSRAGFECTDDLNHDWGPMHDCVNGGKNDQWVAVHTYLEGHRGTTTMGYYTREDLPFYWALADNFTLCDAYHAAIMGPTHPNRIMQLSGTIDPEGKLGGPIVQTVTATGDGNAATYSNWDLKWETMPEVLQDAGVSWKFYTPGNEDVATLPATIPNLSFWQGLGLENYGTWSNSMYTPQGNPEILPETDHVLPYFTNFQTPGTPLYDNAFGQTFPGQFLQDVTNNALPSVSWVIPPLGFDEHPSASSRNGEWFTSLVLEALVSNPEVWSKTALILMYDENDGWFDHVAPPMAPPGTPGEYLTAKLPSTYTANHVFTDDVNLKGKEIKGPLGLGLRVPCLVISPFSRGGHIATDVFDHTSQLQLIEKRFGVKINNISKWRRKTVGDLTSTFQPAAKANATLPSLPATQAYMPLNGVCSSGLQELDSSIGSGVGRYPVKQRMPTQHGTTEPISKYVKLTAEEHAVPDDAHIEIEGEGTATTKSAYNKVFTDSVRHLAKPASH